MNLVISDETLQKAHISAGELQREVAILLFQQEKLTMSQASHLADMSQLQFQHLLASRGIPIHYDVEDFEADLKTLKEKGRL